MPLSADEMDVGRRVRNPDNGTELDIRDTLTGGSGNRYVVGTEPGSDDLQFVPFSSVRDEWEARDPDEVQDERQSEAEQQQSGDEPEQASPGVERADVTGTREGSDSTTGTVGDPGSGQTVTGATDVTGSDAPSRTDAPDAPSQEGPADTEEGQSSQDNPQTNA